MQKNASKDTKYSRNTTTWKIGHHAKAVAHAKGFNIHAHVLGFNIQLNLDALLTLHVENQHAATHFKRDTFSLYEYDLIFGSSVEEAVKRVSKWAAAYYTHPALYYKLPSTNAVTLTKISVPKPSVLQVLTRNEEASMRSCAKNHGKSVRQRNVRQDNTKDRAGTLL